jgi:hypothetical protein
VSEEKIPERYEERLAAAARDWLKVEEGDYYFKEWESGLDHDDIGSLSAFARYFFIKGVLAVFKKASP